MGTFLFLLAALAAVWAWVKLKPKKSTWTPRYPEARSAPPPTERAQTGGDLIQAWRFVPHATPDTPLLALLKYGHKVKSTKETEALPFSPFGYWSPVSVTYRDLGVDLDELPEVDESHAKAIIPPLVEFRKFVEAEGSFEARVAHAEAFCKTKAGKALVAEFKSEYDPFPLAFFYGPLSVLPGVGEKTRALLISSGLKTQRDVALSPDAQLLGIPGIGQKSVGKIRAYISDNPWFVPGTGEVPE